MCGISIMHVTMAHVNCSTDHQHTGHLSHDWQYLIFTFLVLDGKVVLEEHLRQPYIEERGGKGEGKGKEKGGKVAQ